MTINNENYIERIVDLETKIFEDGNQFKIYKPISRNDDNIDFSQFISTYRKFRIQNLKSQKHDFIRLLPYRELPFFQSQVASIGVSIQEIIPNINLHKQTTHENQTKKIYSEILEINPKQMLRNDFYPDCYEEKQISFSISSYSNIWLDEIIPTSQYDSSKYNELLDNREIANLITPKFNGFMKSMKSYIENYEGTINLSEKGYDQVTSSGILIDGKLKSEETIHNTVSSCHALHSSDTLCA